MLAALRHTTDSFFVKLLMLLLIASFALWGIGDIVRSGKSISVARVGEDSISDVEYYSELMRLRTNLGEYFTPEIIESLNLYDTTLASLISNRLVRQEADFMKIEIGDELLKKVLANDSQFFNDKGVFDRDMFDRRIRQLQISEQEYLEQLKQNISEYIIQSTIIPDRVFKETLPQTLYMIQEEQRKTLAFVIEHDREAEAVSQLTPAEEELRAYYDEYKQKYLAPEYRVLNYLLLDKQAVENNVVITDEELRNAYFTQQKQLATPEKRDVSQLLYAKKADVERAYAMLRSGSSMDEIAKEIIPDNIDNIHLGLVTKSQLPAAENTIFELDKGGITSPIQTEFGWHLFRVNNIQSSEIPAFDSMREQLKQELMQQRRNDALNRMVEKVEDSLAAGLDLPNIAQSLNLTATTTIPLDRQGKDGENTQVLDNTRFSELLETGFILDKGKTSELKRLNDGTYFIVQSSEITIERQRALEEVRGLVVNDWKALKLQDTTKADAENILKQLNELPVKTEDAIKNWLSAKGVTYIMPVMVKRDGVVSEQQGETQNDQPDNHKNAALIDVSLIQNGYIEAAFTSEKPFTPLGVSPYGDQGFIAGIYLETIIPDGKQQKEGYDELVKRLDKFYEQEISQQYINALRSRFPVSQDAEAIRRVTGQF